MTDQPQGVFDGTAPPQYEEFRPSFGPTERLATPEELVTLEQRMATWIDANGQPPVYPPDTVYADAEEGRLPVVSGFDPPLTVATLVGEALERFKAQEPAIAERLRIGDRLALSHTAPHYIYGHGGAELPADPGEVAEDLREGEYRITCHIASAPGDQLEATFFDIQRGESSKTYELQNGRSVMVDGTTRGLADHVTLTDYTNLADLLAALERTYSR
jgi:hypothetical protein